MKVIVFGATGHLGKAIVREAVLQGHDVTAVARNSNVVELGAKVVRASATEPSSLVGICSGSDAVISALGKSVSLNAKDRPSFSDVDLQGNLNILAEAQRAGVRKFVYVSAMHAERYPHLEYFRVHHAFAERLKASGVGWSVIKPPALFSAFIDLVDMARNGRLITIGSGDKRTNPVHEADVARVCVAALQEGNTEVETGGSEVFTRRELNDIVQRLAAPRKRMRTVPMGLVKAGLPLLEPFDRNAYDKFAFYLAVLKEDLIAPRVGTMRFEDYVRELVAR